MKIQLPACRLSICIMFVWLATGRVFITLNYIIFWKYVLLSASISFVLDRIAPGQGNTHANICLQFISAQVSVIAFTSALAERPPHIMCCTKYFRCERVTEERLSENAPKMHSCNASVAYKNIIIFVWPQNPILTTSLIYFNRCGWYYEHKYLTMVHFLHSSLSAAFELRFDVCEQRDNLLRPDDSNGREPHKNSAECVQASDIATGKCCNRPDTRRWVCVCFSGVWVFKCKGWCYNIAAAAAAYLWHAVRPNGYARAAWSFV